MHLLPNYKFFFWEKNIFLIQGFKKNIFFNSTKKIFYRISKNIIWLSSLNFIHLFYIIIILIVLYLGHYLPVYLRSVQTKCFKLWPTHHVDFRQPMRRHRVPIVHAAKSAFPWKKANSIHSTHADATRLLHTKRNDKIEHSNQRKSFQKPSLLDFELEINSPQDIGINIEK